MTRTGGVQMYTKNYVMAILIITILVFFSVCRDTICWGRDPSKSVHWTFCVDTSGSMKTKGKRDLLAHITKRITHDFLDPGRDIIKTGDRITIFSFDENVRLETTSLYQTEADLQPIRERLSAMNKRSGKLTFISEAIVRAIDFTKKYANFFHTNALYVFTDGKSEPYSKKWTKARIEKTKKRDKANFERISLLGKDHQLNVWLGVLKWEAFGDAKNFVKNMGSGAHLVDLTDFNRLPLEKALKDFAKAVRTQILLANIEHINLGKIPYRGASQITRNIILNGKADDGGSLPSIMGKLRFDLNNPSTISHGSPLTVATTDENITIRLKFNNADQLKAGTYRGKLQLLPPENQFGTLEIEPSEFPVEFTKSGFLSFYLWRVMGVGIAGILTVFFLAGKIRKKLPLKV
jgi:hypothetical protein